MPLLDGVLRQSSGFLSGIASGGGILSQLVGPLQSRIASVQAGGTPQAKAQALVATLGMRLKSGSILSSGGSGGPLSKLTSSLGSGSGPLSKVLSGGGGGGLLSRFRSGSGGSSGEPAADASLQVAGGARVYAAPHAPSGIAYR